MKHPLGHSRNGLAVHVDLIHSEAAKRIAHQPHLLGLAGEVLQKKVLRGTEIVIEHDTGRSIGYSFVVPTTDTDTVFYAQLLQEEAYTRFVKNGKPSSTQYLTLMLRRDEGTSSYELSDIWIGRISPPLPGSIDETSESKPYWTSHAYILGNQPLQVRTVTKICPY